MTTTSLTSELGSHLASIALGHVRRGYPKQVDPRLPDRRERQPRESLHSNLLRQL